MPWWCEVMMSTQLCTRETNPKKRCYSNSTSWLLSLIYFFQSSLGKLKEKQGRIQLGQPIALLFHCVMLFVCRRDDRTVFGGNIQWLSFSCIFILPLQCIASLIPSGKSYFSCSFLLHTHFNIYLATFWVLIVDCTAYLSICIFKAWDFVHVVIFVH